MEEIDFLDQSREKTFLASMGRIGTSIFIGVVSVLLSLLITIIVNFISGVPTTGDYLLTTILIPALVAPAVTWYFTGAYFRIEKLEHQMRKVATYDSLMGILTRKAFWDIGEERYRQAKALKKSITVLYMDMDNFKQINDQYGHRKGDEILRYWGKELQQLFGKGEVVGRLGGEEVGILLFDVALSKVFERVLELQRRLANIDKVAEDRAESLTMSVGVVVHSDGNRTLDTLLSQADKALYKAKESGKNCTYLYIDDDTFKLLVDAH